MRRTVIVGAGVSGLAAANELTRAGRDVELLDKGRRVGGRLATRHIGAAVLDHGAQFFTTRGPRFTTTVERAQRDGAVVEWCRGFGVPDGYPRYCGADGMASFADWMARGQLATLGVEVAAIESDGTAVSFLADDGTVLAESDDAIITAPVPQMLALLDRGAIACPAALDADLRAVRYLATLALLAVVEGVASVDEPGGMQLDSGPFTFIAENARKGISPVTALTFHAEHDYSLRRFADDPGDVEAELIRLARPWLGEATVVESQLKRWRYAGPVTPLPYATAVIEVGSTRIALAGDVFAGPKVEGAFNSGIAAAEALLA